MAFDGFHGKSNQSSLGEGAWFKLVMVDGSDQLIFTNDNPAPDVFQQDPSCHSSGDPKYCELGEVKPYLESVIGPGGDSTPQNERTWEYGAHFDTVTMVVLLMHLVLHQQIMLTMKFLIMKLAIT